jgi:hypothetical protein
MNLEMFSGDMCIVLLLCKTILGDGKNNHTEDTSSNDDFLRQEVFFATASTGLAGRKLALLPLMPAYTPLYPPGHKVSHSFLRKHNLLFSTS